MRPDRILYLLSPCFGTALMFFFIGQLLPLRISYWRILPRLLPLLLVNAVKLAFGSSSTAGQIATLFSFIFLLLIYPLWLLDGARWKRITVSSVFHVMQILGEGIVYVLLTPSYGTSIHEWTAAQTCIYFLSTWSVYTVICSVCVFLGRSLMLRQPDRFYLLYLALPSSQIILIYCAIFRIQNPLWLLGILLGLAAELALLHYSVLLRQRTKLEREVHRLRQAEKLEQLHYQALDAQREQLAHIRHDLNNSLAAIQYLIQNGERGAAQEMLLHLRADIAAESSDPSTEDRPHV